MTAVMIRATCTIKFGIIVTKEKLIPGFPETKNVNSQLPVPGIFKSFPGVPGKNFQEISDSGNFPGPPIPLCVYLFIDGDD